MELDYLYQLLTEDYTTNIPIYKKTLEKAGYDNPDELIELVVQIDPTHNKYVSWLIKQLKFKNIRLPEDGNRVNEVLTKFLEYSKSPQFPYNKDIYQYKRIHDIEEVVDKIEGVDLTSNRQKIKDIKTEGAKWLDKGDKYSVIELLTPEAASYYGRNTKWCTTDVETAKGYLDMGRLFIILENNEKIAQFFVHKKGIELQLMDVLDREYEPEYDLIGYMESVFDSVSDNPYFYALFAKDIIQARWPEKENIIRNHAPAAFLYASSILEKRWPKAEPTILTSPIESAYYAIYLVKRRWPKAEPVILKDPEAIIVYTSSELFYKKEDENSRWPEAEPVLIKYPEHAVKYAEHNIGGRWPEAEPNIIKEPYYAAEYAVYTLRRRWPEAEPIIKTNKHARNLYNQFFYGSV